MGERFDIAIIGTGLAGLSAAITAKIRNKSVLLFGHNLENSKLTAAHQINNYPGFPAISGKELQENILEHLKSLDIEITNKKVANIYNMGGYFALLADNEPFEADSIIIGSGVNFGKGIEGEEQFLGKGVSYCATCDGLLYRNKITTVIGYDEDSVHEANFLADLAEKVYFIPMYKQVGNLNDKIEIVKDIPVSIHGDTFVSSLELKNTTLTTDAVFILRSTIPPTTLLPELTLDNNHIVVDRQMRTNIPGCFAAGDIVGLPYQYIKAAGEGNIAALSAVSYLDKKKNETT